jgi:N-acetylmuramoyl-L-alanine amidase
MPEHTVEQGDCLESIAVRYGHFWETLWNHPQNADLKKKRKNPNVLLPGDVVFVPEKQPKEESCATDKTHLFRRKGVPSKLRIRLLDDDKPRARQQYRLIIGEQTFTGATDGDGWLEHPIPPEATACRLIVVNNEEEEEYPLELGHLDPIEEVSGVQARLNNLGFDCGPADGILGERTGAAIRAFQRAHGLKLTGKLDEATREKLKAEHGC